MNNNNNNDQLQWIANIRREYTLGNLCRKDLPDHPLVLFECWLRQACDMKCPDPTAMCLATVDQTGQLYQRTVLLKHYDEYSMVFYTNLISRKAQQLFFNPSVSLLFPWYLLDRQVMVLGQAEKVPVHEAKKYFYNRSRNSQISTWTSKQSSFISSREILEKRFIKIKQKFSENEICPPESWGGFRIKIDAMEFWQGRENRLHDRFFYQRKKDSWKIDRLEP